MCYLCKEGVECKCKRCPDCGRCLEVSYILEDGIELCSLCYRKLDVN